MTKPVRKIVQVGVPPNDRPWTTSVNAQVADRILPEDSSLDTRYWFTGKTWVSLPGPLRNCARALWWK